MGGCGSGRYSKPSYPKSIADNLKKVSVWMLLPFLKKGGYNNIFLKWDDNFEIIIKPLGNILYFKYSYDFCSIISKINVLWDKSSIGNGWNRPMFLCPKCGKRCYKLYLKDGCFLCHKCHDLIYAVCLKNKRKISEIIMRLNKIRNILKMDEIKTYVDVFTPLVKPKRLRFFNFIDLEIEYERLQNEFQSALRSR